MCRSPVSNPTVAPIVHVVAMQNLRVYDSNPLHHTGLNLTGTVCLLQSTLQNPITSTSTDTVCLVLAPSVCPLVSTLQNSTPSHRSLAGTSDPPQPYCVCLSLTVHPSKLHSFTSASPVLAPSVPYSPPFKTPLPQPQLTLSVSYWHRLSVL